MLRVAGIRGREEMRERKEEEREVEQKADRKEGGREEGKEGKKSFIGQISFEAGDVQGGETQVTEP